MLDPAESPRASETAKGGSDVASLSPRELEVLSMTVQGMTNRAIASQLDVSVHAIKFHLASIYRKLGVANRTEAAVTFLQGAKPQA